MHKFTATSFIVLLTLFLINCPDAHAARNNYDITLTRSDTFLVTYTPASNSMPTGDFAFATTIPGVYDPVDFATLVIRLSAFDSHKVPLTTRKTAANRWHIDNIAQLSYIQYEIDDSFGSDRTNKVPYIAGTHIDTKLVILNTIGVLGYFETTHTQPVALTMQLPLHWLVGTSLSKSGNRYLAPSFDVLAESPIIAGELELASTTVGGKTIALYSYASNQQISAAQVLKTITPALTANNRFLPANPVKRYVFMFAFLDPAEKKANHIRGIGALEHATSSTYVLSESPKVLEFLNEWVAHEYFHRVTPLKLHSEKIRPFNYQQPNPDKHLWLYEGVTVWASEIMLLRDNQWTVERYLTTLAEKITQLAEFKDKASLLQTSEQIYADSNRDKFDYVDTKGSLCAFYLDLLLLNQSPKTKSMRDLLAELLKKYDVQRPFANDRLLNEIKHYGGPEVSSFINHHIIDNQPIAHNHYLALLGLRYDSENQKIVAIKTANTKQQDLFKRWLTM